MESRVILVFSILAVCALQVDLSAGQRAIFLPPVDDYVTAALPISGGFPFGSTTQYKAYVSTNGYVIFGSAYNLISPDPFDSTYVPNFIVAPYWADSNPNVGGKVSYVIHQDGEELKQISSDIEGAVGISFKGIWLLIVNWNEIPEYGGLASNNNTFTTHLVTDGNRSYAVFDYICGDNNWGLNRVSIGYKFYDQYFESHPLSFNRGNAIYCLNASSTRLIYTLSDPASNISAPDPSYLCYETMNCGRQPFGYNLTYDLEMDYQRTNSPEACCLSSGLSYFAIMEEFCYICPVADWIFHGNTTEVVGSYHTRVLVLPESEEMYRVDFRVLKAGVQFSTDFIVFGHTAVRGDDDDFMFFDGINGVVTDNQTSDIPVNISIHKDDIALEHFETFVIDVNPFNPPFNNFLARTRLLVVINDTTVITAEFEGSNYTQIEGNNLIITISISAEIGSVLILRIVPRDLHEVVHSNLSLPSGFPHTFDTHYPANAHPERKDYDSSILWVQFEPGGPRTKQVSIELFEDEVDEADLEYFVLFLETDTDSNMNIIGGRFAVLCAIEDNDVTQIGFEQASYTFNESTTSPEIFLIIENNSTREINLTISLCVEPETALFDDYGFSASTLTLDPLQSRLLVDGIYIENDDVDFEGTEYFEIRIVSTMNFRAGKNSKTIVNIVDDDGIIEFDKRVYVIEESEKSVVLKVEHTLIQQNITAMYYTEDGSAKGDQDYEITNQNLIFTAGEQQQNITILVNDDPEAERDENFFVYLNVIRVGQNILEVQRIQAEIRIQQSDRITCFIDDACSMALPPEEATGVFVNEDCCLHRDGLSFKLPGNDSQCIHCLVLGWMLNQSTNSTLNSTYCLNEGVTQSFQYGYLKSYSSNSFSLNHTAHLRIDRMDSAEYTDFSVNKIGEVQFPGEVVVSAHHDTIALEDEDKFTLVLEDFSEQQSLDIYVVSIDMLTIVIQDLTSISVQFSRFNYRAAEDEDKIELQIITDTRMENDLQLKIVPFSLAELYSNFETGHVPVPNSTKLPNSFPELPTFIEEQPYIANERDYEQMIKYVKIEAGKERSRSAIFDFFIGVIDDHVNEALEQYFVVMLEVADPILGSRINLKKGRFAALCTIVDDDDISFGFERELYAVTENDNASNLVFIVSNQAITSEQAFNISVSTTSITATVDEDFETKNMEVFFPPNARKVAVPLVVINDNEQEEKELFSLQLTYSGSGTPFHVTRNSIAEVSITDDDGVTIRFDKPSYTVMEHMASVTVTIHKMGEADANITVLFTTEDVSRTTGYAATGDKGDSSKIENYDYRSVDKLISFGTKESSVNVTIELVDDAIPEGTERFMAVLTVEVLQSSLISVILAISRTVIVIVDDPVIGFSNEDYVIYKSNETVTLIITKFGDVNRNLTVIVTTGNISANYVHINTTVTFTPTDTMKEVTVMIGNDMDFEQMETFVCTLTIEDKEVLLSPASATITILDDNNDITVSSPAKVSSTMTSVPLSTVAVTKSPLLTVAVTKSIVSELSTSPALSIPPSAVPPATDSTQAIVLGSTLGLLAIVLTVCIAICVLYCGRRQCYNSDDSESNMQQSFALKKHSTPAPRQLHMRGMSRIVKAKMVISGSSIRLLDSIGEGEFGMVYKAHLIVDVTGMPELIAVKTLKHCYNSEENSKLIQESLRMMDLDHPNVLGLIGVCVDAGPAPYLVMPYMAQGSLLTYLKKHRADLVFFGEGKTNEEMMSRSEKRLLDMCVQTAKGMEYLASRQLVHRDLAARNCMMGLNSVIKVADFGLTEVVYAQNYFRQDKDSTLKLPVKWMAPESLNDGLFTEASDVWSFGVTCWEVYSGGISPYPGINPFTLPRLLALGKKLDKPLNTVCGSEVYDTMLSCWMMDPTERPTFSQLVVSLSCILDQLAGYFDLNAEHHEHHPAECEPQQKDHPAERVYSDETRHCQPIPTCSPQEEANEKRYISSPVFKSKFGHN